MPMCHHSSTRSTRRKKNTEMSHHQDSPPRAHTDECQKQMTVTVDRKLKENNVIEQPVISPSTTADVNFFTVRRTKRLQTAADPGNNNQFLKINPINNRNIYCDNINKLQIGKFESCTEYYLAQVEITEAKVVSLSKPGNSSSKSLTFLLFCRNLPGKANLKRYFLETRFGMNEDLRKMKRNYLDAIASVQMALSVSQSVSE